MATARRKHYGSFDRISFVLYESSDSDLGNYVRYKVSVEPVNDSCLASFPSDNDRYGDEEKERQPVSASRGYKHCGNEYRAHSDLQAVVHTKLISFLSLASARFGSPAHLLLPLRRCLVGKKKPPPKTGARKRLSGV